MTSEVGSGQVAILPTFKGFRSATTKEVDSTASASANTFRSTFGKSAAATGASSGKQFKASFSQSSSGLVSAATAEVAKASRELAAVRVKELDVTGRVRLAESQLAEARNKYADGSSQVVRAEERLATASRQLITAQNSVKESSDRLAASKTRLAAASTEAATSSGGFQSVLSRLPFSFGEAGGSSARSFGSSFGSSFGAVFGGVTVASLAFGAGRAIGDGIRTGIDYTLGSVPLASDLSETTSAVTQVYGDASADIIKFSSGANKNLGQTRVQALKAAQTFGVFAKQAGLTDAPLANFSTGLVTLAGDLASFYNTSPDEAIDAIGAGLRGEAEPLRRFGVLLDDATLRAKAYELGIYDGNDALTGQQRILAAQSVIFDQTGIAQGDFARTSTGLANQQRILAASMEDTQTKLGEYLLPAFTSAATYANESLVPALGALIDQVGPVLGQALTDAGPQLDELAGKFINLAGTAANAAANDLPSFLDSLGKIVDFAADGLNPDKFYSPSEIGSDFRKSLDKWLKENLDGDHDFFYFGNKAGTELGAGMQFGLDKAFVETDLFSDSFYQLGNDSGSNFSDGLGLGIVGSLPNVKPKLHDTFFGFGTDGVTSLESGFASGTSDWENFGVPAGEKLGKGTVEGVKRNDFSELGKYAGFGFAQGITDSTEDVVGAVSQLGDVAYNTLRDRMKIASPSKRMKPLGGYTVDGYIEGILEKKQAVQSAVSGLVSIPNASVAASAGGAIGVSGTGVASERPIYADGSLFGWVREMANGEAQLVVAGYDRTTAEVTSRGVRGWE